MSEIECEFGSSHPIRFGIGILCNSEGEEVLCKCGKPSETAIMGKSAYVARCNECMECEDNGYN